jgi:two-component system chemotaxis sensor kinase CheA
VLQADGQQFGLVVDQVLNTQEIVVKPLGRQVKGVGVYAGATILGNGRVALILDVRAFARLVHAVRETDAVEDDSMHLDAEATDEHDDRLLVVGLGGSRRVGIPVEMVTRLEDLPASAIEHVGNQKVIQYRDRVLPLVDLGSLLGGKSAAIGDELKIVLYDRDGQRVGLIVESIVDIAARSKKIHSEVTADGLLGSAVVEGRVTGLLDVEGAIRSVDPRFLAEALAQTGN